MENKMEKGGKVLEHAVNNPHEKTKNMQIKLAMGKGKEKRKQF